MPLFVRSRSEGSAHSESDDALRTRFRIWAEDEIRRLERLVGENLDQWPFTLGHTAPIRMGAATVADILESDGQYREGVMNSTERADILESDGQYRERLRDWARGTGSSDSVLFEDMSLHRDLFENVSIHLDRSFDSVLDEWAEHNSRAPRRLTLTIHKDDIVQTEKGEVWRVIDFSLADQTVTLMPFRQGAVTAVPADSLLRAVVIESVKTKTPGPPPVSPTIWEHLSEEDEEIH